MDWRHTVVCGALVALAAATPAQETTALPLHLAIEDSRDVVVKPLAPDGYTLVVTGPSPRVATVPISAEYDHASLQVLSFELRSPSGLAGLSVLYGPLDAAHCNTVPGVVAGADWATVAVPLRANWDQPYTTFCLDVSVAPGATLALRGLVLRAMTATEQPTTRSVEEGPVAPGGEPPQTLRSYLSRAWPARIESVSVDRRYVRITGVTTEAGTALVELPPNAALSSRSEGISVTTLSAQGDFQVEVPRLVDGRAGTSRDRIFARWRLARPVAAGLEPLSAAAWAVDADEAVEERAVRSMPMSKKGLAGVGWFPEVMTDLADLGCRNLTVNIVLPSILHLTAESKGTTRISFNGREYGVHEPAMEPLDRVLRFAREHGITVSAAILVPRCLDDPDEQRVWCHPDVCEPGVYSMANVTTAEGVDAYAAALDVLVRRYGRSGTATGRISNWIVHSNVDEGWVWANAGRKTVEAYVELYYRVLRLTHSAVRRHDSAARVFIPLSHHWATADADDYRPREMLELLRDWSRREGDFEWGVAYHAYPEDPQDPRPWLDKNVTFSFDTPLITMKNIEVLDAWMRRPDFRFNGTVRSVLLAEQGCNSPDLSLPSQQLQAAAVVYFWHKVKDLESVEAFHYQRWIDHAREGGLHLGLRACVPGTITTPGEKKMAWDVFRALGTADESAATEFAKPLIGVTDFAAVRYLDPIR